MARKKAVASDEPIKLFDIIKPTGPILSKLGVTGKVIGHTENDVTVVWSCVDFKTETGLVRLPKTQRIKREGVCKV